MPYILSTVFNKKIKLFSTNFLRLSKAPFGRKYEVVEMQLPASQKRRLTHVGAYVGCTVTPLRTAPLADPTEYLFGEVRICISKRIADKISVKEISADE